MRFGLTKRNSTTAPDINSFRSDIDRLFDNFFNLQSSDFFESQWMPEIDVHEDDKFISITADLAGMDEKDINLSLENNILTLSGTRNEEKEQKKGKSVITERRSGSFCRSVSLPEGIDRENVTADLKKGVLKVKIGKNPDKESGKIKISVN